VSFRAGVSESPTEIQKRIKAIFERVEEEIEVLESL